MKIKEITFEMGNDFAAVMECEHCQSTQKLSSGYHDNFYHTRVIPAMTCKSCGKNRDGKVQTVAQTESAIADSVQRPCSTSTQQETYNRLRGVGWWPVTGAVILERNGEFAIVHADGHVTVAA